MCEMNENQFDFFQNLMIDYLNSFSKVFYRFNINDEGMKIDENPEPKLCYLCNVEIKTGDLLRKMNCEHVMHSECLIPYYDQHHCCPVCKKPTLIELEEDD